MPIVPINLFAIGLFTVFAEASNYTVTGIRLDCRSRDHNYTTRQQQMNEQGDKVVYRVNPIHFDDRRLECGNGPE